ncbi:HAMP domain protein [Mycolicibacterium hassiacum DSM 44199]|uniref:HAMP domain protein n=1 Tax=Mycolicibacterium hassiacum (strain DSM 44199 / CIP 105218 / JCM 12690 / 3849) TaxID=1122247 RepID=K5B9L7_MYCHD|nr:adenylate/guanylate cyclase domain-containing protein [Mycolicibacterium hassiacum]EKF25668.1 HAMP domain protein [Mycolicibacterium hassiacum DSM 44199]MDA4084585.1 cyclase [Mycolicibacterium hassiacum DSM 44199]VCT90941.1 Adenylate cyclase 2 [Mycolicibacterium hassiacum DSM 44199]
MKPRRLIARYAAGLTSAYLLTSAEVAALIVSLTERGQTSPRPFVIAAVALVVVGTIAVAVGAVFIAAPARRWLGIRPPTDAERRTALKTMRRQTALTLAPWVLTAAVLIPLSLSAPVDVQAVIGSAILFGTIASVSTGFLFTLRTLRPLLAGVTTDFSDITPVTAPGVRTQLLLTWTVCTALPGLGIAALLVLRANGWVIAPDTRIELALLVLALVAVVLGLRAIILVAISISDPVREVIDAMAEVERGRIDRTVQVYDWSEIGRLQAGFNRMVAGLRERERLRDLFGRHVGAAVARRAIAEDSALSGDEREVAVLFVDLVGSTQLAATREPHEVAEILNEFFRIVVAEVDQRDGLVNKFQGDAALAVFGAPLRIADPAGAALATARRLGVELRRLPIDIGIGVSAGPVFAGNIGAENRYEYTVVGDAVNEAARLADRAKEFEARVLCSEAALRRAPETERSRWRAVGTEVLRGRTAATEMSCPVSG